MRLNNKQVWYSFAYDLLFPAILGSMIYDVADARQAIALDWNYRFKLLILAFYCLDYLFLYNDIKGPAGNQKPSEIALDLLIGVLYRVAFSFAQLESYRWALVTFVLILALIYFYLKGARFGKVYFSILCGIMIVAAGYSVLARDRSDAKYNFAALFGVFVAYFFYVFYLFDHYVKVKTGNVT